MTVGAAVAFIIGVILGLGAMAFFLGGSQEEDVAERVAIARRNKVLEETLGQVVEDRDRMAAKLTAIGDLLNGGSSP